MTKPYSPYTLEKVLEIRQLYSVHYFKYAKSVKKLSDGPLASADERTNNSKSPIPFLVGIDYNKNTGLYEKECFSCPF